MISPDGSMSGQGTGQVQKIMQVVGEPTAMVDNFDVSKAEAEVRKLQGQLGVIEGEMNRMNAANIQEQMATFMQTLQDGEAVLRNNKNQVKMIER